MIRFASLLVSISISISISISFACADGEPNAAEPPAKVEPAKTEPSKTEPAKTEASETEPTPVTEERVTITADRAAAAGLPAIGISLATTGSGMSGSQLGGGEYLRLSGPPGGPLMLIVSPTTIDAKLASLIDAERLGGATLVEEQVELLGASRSAAAWIVGESLARTSWCAVILGRPDAEPGDAALLLELGVGHQGDAAACKTALEHPVLRPILTTLKLD